MKAFATPCGLVWDGTVAARWLRSEAISKLRAEHQRAGDIRVRQHGGAAHRRGALPPRNGSYTHDSLLDVFGRNPPCRTTQSASGAMLPGPPEQFLPFAFGSKSANLALFTGVEPVQYGASGATNAEATQVSNCNDNNAGVTINGVAGSVWTWQLPLEQE